MRLLNYSKVMLFVFFSTIWSCAVVAQSSIIPSNLANKSNFIYEQFKELEIASHGRIGVYAINTANKNKNGVSFSVTSK